MWGYLGILEKWETTIQGLGLGFMEYSPTEYGFGNIIIRSPYTPYSIYLRGTLVLAQKWEATQRVVV